MVQIRRFHVAFLPVAIGTLLAVGASGQPTSPGVREVLSIEGVTEYACTNGLRVLLFPDSSRPTVTLSMTYLVGSRHEDRDERGMAHLLEHVLFLRTKGGRDVKKALTERGARWNGTTSLDRTNYFETLPAGNENIRWLLDLEAERMVNMRIDNETLASEIKVVQNEFDSGESNPTSVLYKRTLTTAYTVHGYGNPAVGNRSDIERVSAERLTGFYQTYYRPDNAVLVIAGNFEPGAALACISQTIGRIPRPTRQLPLIATEEPVQDGERQIVLRRLGDTPVVTVAYHLPSSAHPDTPAIQVLTDVMGNNPAGRIYKELVVSKKAADTRVIRPDLHDPGFLIVFALLKQEMDTVEAREALIASAESVQKRPPTEDEVERAKRRILKQIELSLSDTEQIGVRLGEFAAVGDWRLMFFNRDQIKAVQASDVVRVARAYVKRSNQTVGEFVPTEVLDRAEIPRTPHIAGRLASYKGGEPIQAGEVFDPSLENIEKRVVRRDLVNGLRLVILPKKNRGGTAWARVQLRFGDPDSLRAKGATAELTGGALMGGTKYKSRQEIQDECDRLKANISVSGEANSATGLLQTTEANLAEALRLVGEVLRYPAFPANEFDEVKRQVLAETQNTRSDPGTLAAVHLRRQMAPYVSDDIRYQATPDERIEQLNQVTLDDVRRFHGEYYGASEGEVVVVGQCDPAQVESVVTQIFGNWKSSKGYRRVSRPYQQVKSRVSVINTPDKPNAALMAGINVRMTDADPDYPAMMLANYIFGGAESSRLFRRIRDRDGLSYRIYSHWVATAGDDGGRLTIGATSKPRHMGEVEAAVREVLAQILKDGFTEDEVTAARRAWLQERRVERSRDRTLLSLLASRAEYGRTTKWDIDMEATVSALSAEQVTDAFRRHVNAANFSLVKAGDFHTASGGK